MRIKVKSRTTSKVLTIDDDISYKELIGILQDDDSLVPEKQAVTAIKSGFPPQPLSIADDTTIKGYIKNGDQLLLETDNSGAAMKDGTNNGTEAESNVKLGAHIAQQESIPNVFVPELGSYLILRNIPDDNSCMFNALNYAMKKDNVPAMREVVASHIRSDPEKYNEVILGRSNDDYCRWITKKDSWGGAIELGILSQYYKIQINCLDIELGQTIKFEPSPDCGRFIVLIYSGIHYDILSLNSKVSNDDSDKSHDTCVFSTSSDLYHTIFIASNKICQLLQSKDYATNLTKFRLRCLECYTVCVGETGASKHALETGHSKFGETK